MPKFVQPRLLVAAIVAAGLALAGCGRGAETTAAQQDEPKTREVKSDFGNVTIPTNPQHALGMYTTDIDILITLGIPLADSQPIRGDGYTDFPKFFPQEQLDGIKTFHNYPEFNYEAILAAKPDFILNGLGYEKEVVKRLPEIAPTYSIDAFDGSDWREKFEQIATALGRRDAYQKWMDNYQKKVDAVRARLEATKIDPVVAPVTYGMNGKIVANCYGVPCLVFNDLGLRISPLTKGPKGEGTEFSLEELEKLNGIDVAFRSAFPTKTGELQSEAEALKDVASNKIWKNLRFVKNGAYVPFDMEMLYGSPSGHEAFLDVVEKALLD
ncbi:ABC transporter substrate-binding protein [Tenggerimyces flavus]|uniref:ABC transporter substrate-binding protein n=1 Tax=Tenggerimyces flavus TaxID=1708749 RepID=A0ABV7YL67_9ACTN|nr:ABC transporter substrate-binding protein [Tenggerimyces flavus]MBM7789346.1 iron complex transport system substrate-binding protein [Tenggerimyces flavus]